MAARAARAVSAGSAAPTAPRRSAVVATLVGNFLEFSDFLAFGLFAIPIGRAFFPATSPGTSLLLSLATFGIGFLTRPLGGLVLGAYADRAGRRAGMMLSLVIMAVGSGALAVVPPFARIGLAAPLVVVVARLLQGFAAGGEFGSATSYLLETAPRGREARATIWQSVTQTFATIAVGTLAFALERNLSAGALDAWGWRIPFAIGILIAPFGIYLRRHLPETLDAAEATRTRGLVPREIWGALVVAAGMICGPTVSTYANSYMATYAQSVLHTPAWVGSALVIGGSAFIAVGAYAGAWCGDRFGYKRAMNGWRLVYIVALLPGFAIMTHRGATVATLLEAQSVLSLLFGFAIGPIYVLMASAFPRFERGTGLALSYALSVAIFGGTAQFVMQWLIGRTGNPLVPAYYMIVANCVTVAATIVIRPAGSSRIAHDAG